MKLYLRQIEDTIIFREETSQIKKRYEIRANRNDEYYYFHRNIHNFEYEYYNIYSVIDPVKENGNTVLGFWRYKDSPELARVIFFRPNNCSCGQKYCVHEQIFLFIREIVQCKNINSDNVTLNVMKYLEF